MDVISFSLWGSNEHYRVGALENARQRVLHYPEWTYRFYVSESEPESLVAALEGLGCQIKRMGPGSSFCKFWRHLAAEDPEIDRLLVRDIDSRPSLRETACVSDWVASGKTAHFMRDHPAHDHRVMAGMYGIKAACFRDVGGRLSDWLHAGRQKWMPRNSDQPFLAETLYPRVAHDCLIHDSFRFFKDEDSRPFPTARIGGEHVGGYVYADGSTNARNEKAVCDAEAFTRPAS